MMFQLLKRFRRDRRGAIFMIFAASLVPLMMLVGLSIDYSFFAQARAQFSLAGDSAASYAIRVATATFALDSQAGETVAVATQNAEYAGNAAGNQWFNSQIATLPTAYLQAGTPNTTVAPELVASNPTGFTASVAYQGVYPPFFDLLFKTTRNWYVTGTAKATSSYTYSEILVLMDTSGSMYIGANQSDINTLDDNTVCVPNADFSWTTDLSGPYPGGDGAINPGYYGNDTNDNIPDWSKVTGYTPAPNNTSQNQTGTCNSSYNHNASVAAMSPCAFACHTTTATWSNGGHTYTQDLYGFARSLGVTLRIDSVFAAAEEVIEAMQASEQVTGQYAVGVYQFNDNIAPIAPVGTSTTAPAEATTDLATALGNVENDDYQSVNYNKTPAAVTVPMLAEQTSGVGPDGTADCTPTSICESYDYTNFPLAMQEWSPNFTNVTSKNTPVSKLTAAGTGSSISSPLKSLIIITDGLEDSTPGTSSQYNRLQGEMTGVYAETHDVESGATNLQALCQPLKNLGYTIYILYINYYPAPIATYYLPDYAATSTPYVNQDFPTSKGGNLPHTWNVATGGTLQNWIYGNNTQNEFESGTSLVSAANKQTNPVYETDPDPPGMTVSPDEQAMEACVGPAYQTPGATITTSNYFFPATNATDINNAMVNILQSALNTTTRITN